MAEAQENNSAEDNPVPRREFLCGSTVAMAGGLVASYGTLAVFAGAYLYPAKPQRKEWLFVVELSRMRAGDSLNFVDPTGAKIVVTRHKEDGVKEDFVALSSVCPHLGCQVHWKPLEKHFLCPCHNGKFDAEGKAFEGPPAAAKQWLAHYELDVVNGMLLIEVPIERLV